MHHIGHGSAWSIPLLCANTTCDTVSSTSIWLGFFFSFNLLIPVKTSLASSRTCFKNLLSGDDFNWILSSHQVNTLASLLAPCCDHWLHWCQSHHTNQDNFLACHTTALGCALLCRENKFLPKSDKEFHSNQLHYSGGLCPIWTFLSKLMKLSLELQLPASLRFFLPWDFCFWEYILGAVLRLSSFFWHLYSAYLCTIAFLLALHALPANISLEGVMMPDRLLLEGPGSKWKVMPVKTSLENRDDSFRPEVILIELTFVLLLGLMKDKLNRFRKPNFLWFLIASLNSSWVQILGVKSAQNSTHCTIETEVLQVFWWTFEPSSTHAVILNVLFSHASRLNTAWKAVPSITKCTIWQRWWLGSNKVTRTVSNKYKWTHPGDNTWPAWMTA